MDLNTFLEQTFNDVAANVPGFISVTLIKSDDGTLFYSHPAEMRKELVLISPFHLQIYKQAAKSLEMEEDNDVVKEILITTEHKLYVLASRTGGMVGVLTLDIEKANLGIARMYSKKIGDSVYDFLKKSMYS